MERGDTDNFAQVFLGQVPLIDTRAPVEFARGTVPGAVNLPLMLDDERAAVGKCYKHEGQEAAIRLGHRLISGARREERLAAWRDFAQRHPDGYLFCFRGGMRSEIAQQWLREAGCPYPRVTGGYKAMRQFLLATLSDCIARAEFWLVAGATGSGKTRLIQQLSRAVDLEELARHRGSAFGRLLEPQPAQIDFENQIAVALLRLAQSPGPIILEDEGRLIGRLSLPEELRVTMQSAPLLLLDYPLDERVEVVLQDYIHDLGTRFLRAHGAEGARLHQDRLRGDLLRTQKRLGRERCQLIVAQLDEAFAAQESGEGVEAHRAWIRELLAGYYDPMYRYQLSQRTGERLAQGTREEIMRFIHEHVAEG
ncbi:MAG: tRNA 2-selenouridine(34) synthase MnmH [Pseudomonadota bacterium]